MSTTLPYRDASDMKHTPPPHAYPKKWKSKRKRDKKRKKR